MMEERKNEWMAGPQTEKGREQGGTLELESAMNLLIVTHPWRGPVTWKSANLSLWCGSDHLNGHRGQLYSLSSCTL